MSARDITSKGEGLARSRDLAGDVPLLRRKSVLVGMLTSGLVIANAAVQPSASATGTVKPSAIAATQPTYVPRWAPSTTYALGQQIVSPNNDVVSATVAHMSSAVYGTDAANWNLSSTYASAAKTPIVVNVKSYGAVGDGKTVDSAAIAVAIKACVSAGGGIVDLPVGTYVVSGLELASNVTMRGAGMGATILLMDSGVHNTPVIRVCSSSASASYVVLQDLTINGNQDAYGNSSSTRNIGYYLGVGSSHTLNDCSVINVEFLNNKSYALDIECQSGGTMRNISCKNCHIHDNGFSTGTGSNNQCDGITMIGNDITVIDCWSENNSGNGILVGQNSTVWHRNKILGCHVANNTLAGIKLGAGIKNSLVSANICIGNGVTYASSSGSGIALTSTATLNTITANTCSGNYVQGIRIDAATYNSITGNICEGNSIRGSGDAEIYLTSSSHNNIVSANVINAINATYAIAEQGSSSGPNTVTGNIAQAGALNPLGAGSRWTNNTPYQPKGYSVPQPLVPATTVSAAIPARTAQQDCMVYVTAGIATTTIAVAHTTVLVIPASGVGSLYVTAGSTVTPTYASGTPTWRWFGL